MPNAFKNMNDRMFYLSRRYFNLLQSLFPLLHLYRIGSEILKFCRVWTDQSISSRTSTAL